MSKPAEYEWIAKWGQLMGSYAYYIKEQQERAARDNAPLNAIYLHDEHGWQTTDDITNPSTLARLGLPQKEGSNG